MTRFAITCASRSFTLQVFSAHHVHQPTMLLQGQFRQPSYHATSVGTSQVDPVDPGAARQSSRQDDIRLMLKRGAALIGRPMRRSVPGVRLLGYHRIGGASRLQIDVPAIAFKDQLRELRSRGAVLALSSVLEADPVSKDVFSSVLTFDDGFADTFENGIPIFREFGVPAIFYLATADIKRGWIPTSAGRGAAVSPADIRDLSKDPLFSFGSHGHSHQVLVRLSDEEIRDDLLTSKSIIENWTGRPVLDFAYPKGMWDRRVEGIVRTVFRSAVFSGSRPFTGDADPHRIRRYPIQAIDEIDVFRAKLDGALFLEDAARSARDRLRVLAGRIPER
jgi:peptidoglycan/xylan/chitin deacetylase (PgdA/CDA1 family)